MGTTEKVYKFIGHLRSSTGWSYNNSVNQANGQNNNQGDTKFRRRIHMMTRRRLNCARRCGIDQAWARWCLKNRPIGTSNPEENSICPTKASLIGLKKQNSNDSAFIASCNNTSLPERYTRHLAQQNRYQQQKISQTSGKKSYYKLADLFVRISCVIAHIAIVVNTLCYVQGRIRQSWKHP